MRLLPRSPAHRLAPVGERRRKHWGWGYEDQQPTPEQARAAAPTLSERLGIAVGRGRAARPARRVAAARAAHRDPRGACRDLRATTSTRAPRTRSASPTSMSCAASADTSSTRRTSSRAPRDESDVERLLEWCSAERVAAIPFGGGTSVVGGVTPAARIGSYNGAVSIDLAAFDGLLELDRGLALGADPGRRHRARRSRRSWASTG